MVHIIFEQLTPDYSLKTSSDYQVYAKQTLSRKKIQEQWMEVVHMAAVSRYTLFFKVKIKLRVKKKNVKQNLHHIIFNMVLDCLATYEC